MKSGFKSMLGDAIEFELEWCALEFHKGNRWMLFHAIGLSCTYGVVLPSALVDELRSALDRYQDYKAKSLDEAFGLVRPKGQSWDKLRRWLAPDPATGLSLYYTVVARFKELEEADRVAGHKPKVTQLRAQVAEEFKISPGTVFSMLDRLAKAHTKP